MMLLATILAATTEELHSLPMPPIGYAGIAFAAFLVLGVVTWSYRDVSNRHRSKTGAGNSGHSAAGDGGHDAAGH